MNITCLYGVYKDYSDDTYKIGEIRVIKETAKRIFVERSTASGFVGQFDKERDGYYTTATTPAKAIANKRNAFLEDIERAEQDLQIRRKELDKFNRDVE